MRRFKRKYSKGSVKPYTKVRNGKESKPKWQATIREGVVTEATDANGVVILEKNGSPKLVTHWKTLIKVFTDIECVPYKYRDDIRYRGQREAEQAFRQWRAELIAKADADYEAAVAKDDSDARSRTYKFGSMTVPAFMDLYIKERVEDGLEPSTIEGYRYSAKYVAEFYSNVTLEEVDGESLVTFNRAMKNRGLGATTRSKALKVFKAAFDAHRIQIGTYPFEGCKKWWPHAKQADPNPLDERSLRKVLDDIAQSRPTSFMCAVEIALRTSMRVGEICGLKWASVDMETGSICVNNAIGRVSGGTRCYEKRPKYTGRDEDHDSTRFVPGNQKLKAMFERRFDFMVEEVKLAKRQLTDEEARDAVRGMYVIGKPDGSYANPTVVGRTWKGYSQGLMGTKGRRPTFHSLRDTYISQAITEGHVDPATVSKIAGHNDPGFTMRTYTDSQKATMESAQATMNDLF